MRIKRFFALLPCLLLAACDSGFHTAEKIANDVKNESACSDFSAKLSSTLVQALIDQNQIPDEGTLRQALTKQLGPQSALIEKAIETFRLVTSETQNRLGIISKDDLLAAITALDIGDETTQEKALLKSDLQKSYVALQASAKEAGLDCAAPSTPTTPIPPSTGSPVPTAENPVSRGAYRVMTTAYQSCSAAELESMDRSSPSIASGAIKVTGTHSSGTGLKREVASLPILQKSHYYIKEGIEKGKTCFDVTKNPLIYDYGGKPYATTSLESSLNLFKNAGSGTQVLGIDCSGFVFSALAASGLRVAPTKRAQAYLVFGINARMYMEPKKNGLTCLAPVPSRKADSLRSGDILASTGHIVILDRVGKDPFGIERFSQASQCVSANMSTERFDFDVVQSAPVKGGVGIDRMRAATYFAESGSMRTALLQYALAACKAKFSGEQTLLPSSARLVRHSLTKECTDRPVPIENESCVASCTAKASLTLD